MRLKLSKFSKSGVCTLGAVAATVFLVAFVTLAHAEETYLPECFTPAPGVKVIKYPARKGPYRLALVNGFAGNSWRIQMIQSAKAWAARPENAKDIKEFRVVSVGDDIAKQIAAIDNFISAGVDGIVFIALNPTSFGPVIKRAKKAGTVLVPYDCTLDTDEVVQINLPNENIGRVKGEALVKYMGTKGKVLEVRGLLGNDTERDRHNGLHKVLSKYPDIEVVTVVGQWNTGIVQKVTGDAIATHSKFDGISVCHGTTGAINAMIDAGHPIVPVVGDDENGPRILMAKNKIPGVSLGMSPAQSAMALKAAVALLKGEPLPQQIHIAIPIVYSEELESGVNYFPNQPPTLVMTKGYPNCGFDPSPEELFSQTGDNR